MEQPDESTPEVAAAAPMRATRLLRNRTIWITTVVITAILICLMTLIYVGSVVDPLDHLHGLPVLIVDEDAGTTVGSQHVDIGSQIVSALRHAPAVTDRLALRTVTMAPARADMARNGAYATIVLPAQFTRSTLALYGVPDPAGSAPPLPTIELLTNVRAGSLGVSLATGVAGPGLAAISHAVGHTLGSTFPAGAGTGPAAQALRDDPFTVTTVAYRPLPAHSALGLSAFYISLLAIMCGFLGATLINTTVDSALGYATNEVGPKWMQRLPVRITRWQTLLAKWVMAVVLAPILVGLLLLVAIGVLHMDAAYVGLLWVFLSFAAVVIALGTLVLFAALGNLGQVVAILIFVYLALASSGGTIPIQALPGVLRFAANFEPLRQILDGVRSVLYFDASGAAGLTRGFVLTAVGLALWVVLGIAVTTTYDRRGLYRMRPELVEYVTRSAAAYGQPAPDDESPTP
jgi:YhgE/Pip-like protein